MKLRDMFGYSLRGVLAGIDIGTITTTTVVVRQEDGKMRVIGVGSAPSAGMRRGMVVNAEEAAHSLRRSLHAASRSSGVPIRSAIVGIGGAHLGSFTTRGAVAVSRADGEITEDDVGRAVAAAEGLIPKNPNREIVHLIPHQFKVDGQPAILDPVGMVGMKLEVEVLGVDAARPALANIIKCCELAGIEIEDWASSTLASAELLLSREQKELGAMLLDLGAGTSDFAVFEEGRLVDVGAFPIGGGHITADIAIGLRMPVRAAEELKIHHAQAITDRVGGRREHIQLADFVSGETTVLATRDLVDIVAARLTDIFELSTKSLKKIGRAGLLPGGVVLSGGVADISGIQDLARRELKLPVEVAKAVAVEGMADVLPSRLAVPVGLILWRVHHPGPLASRHSGQWGGIGERIKRMLRAFVP